ncbi:NUDIX domain-containing protein [Alkalinema sp. FACHB-956]|uniref:NUDIX hydrolase n=1 Tax=Alkalinema sp. FACHB-956 TaxID=2692768 RepID=UPI001689AA83|nr:NUDIX domain-containing protein [Alkalinema sp. FACHB-956]MBD2327058.1 NUDIX domain-containing protein [Alkalinema sp. FACHB-956]
MPMQPCDRGHCYSLPFNVKTTIRVAAYILRQNSLGQQQLLMFQHPDCAEAPIQIPGGGVEPNESIETALYREIWEESGLSHLTVIRKLGVVETCWRLPRKQISYRHCFLLRTQQPTPECWQQSVQGTGIDSGMQFSYFWGEPRSELFQSPELSYFLNSDAIPELYGH